MKNIHNSMENIKIKKINEIDPCVRPYLFEIDNIIKKYIGFDNVYSIILFGSYARGEHSPNSDCDVLIILKDDFYKQKSKNYFNNLEKIFLHLEKKHSLKNEKSGLIFRVLYVVEKSTGMFISHFICKESAWKNQEFHKIFNVNRFLASFLAPGDIVLKNLGNSYKILFGDVPHTKSKNEISMFQLLKSLIMNELIAIGAIIIYPIFKNSIQYSMELFKWSIRNSYVYLFNKSFSLNKALRFFRRRGLSSKAISFFMQLRQKYSNNTQFLLSSPYNCLKIHGIALMYRKTI